MFASTARPTLLTPQQDLPGFAFLRAPQTRRQAPVCTPSTQCPGLHRTLHHSSSIAASSSAGHSTGGSSNNRNRRRARHPGTFEVKVISPPSRSLGIHALPADTHNGDMIEVQGNNYVVECLVLKYKLVAGRYQRDHSRLEVQSTSRFILNKWLHTCFEAEGAQDQ